MFLAERGEKNTTFATDRKPQKSAVSYLINYNNCTRVLYQTKVYFGPNQPRKHLLTSTNFSAIDCKLLKR